MDFDYSHPVYLAARAEAFLRSGGVCQFCGQEPAAEAHHWHIAYKKAADTTGGDLTALCVGCHDLVTMLRLYLVQRAGKKAAFLAAIEKFIGE